MRYAFSIPFIFKGRGSIFNPPILTTRASFLIGVKHWTACRIQDLFLRTQWCEVSTVAAFTSTFTTILKYNDGTLFSWYSSLFRNRSSSCNRLYAVVEHSWLAFLRLVETKALYGPLLVFCVSVIGGSDPGCSVGGGGPEWAMTSVASGGLSLGSPGA